MPQEVKMTEIYMMPGNLIRRLNQISLSIFQDETKAAGLELTSVQFAVLAALAENDGVDQATVAGLIAYDRPTTGSVLDRLESRGLIRRETNPNDRRARLVWITEDGKEVLGRALPVVRNLQQSILTGLSKEEQETFIALAAKVAEAGNDLSRAPLILPKAP